VLSAATSNLKFIIKGCKFLAGIAVLEKFTEFELDPRILMFSCDRRKFDNFILTTVHQSFIIPDSSSFIKIHHAIHQ